MKPVDVSLAVMVAVDLGACLCREPACARRIFAGADDDIAFRHRGIAVSVRNRGRKSRGLS